MAGSKKKGVAAAASSTPPLDEDKDSLLHGGDEGDNDDDERPHGVLVRDDGTITSTTVFLMIAPVLYVSGQRLWAAVSLLLSLVLAGLSMASNQLPFQDRLEIWFDVRSAHDAVQRMKDAEHRITQHLVVVAQELGKKDSSKATENKSSSESNIDEGLKHDRIIKRGLLVIRVGLASMAKKYGKVEQRRRGRRRSRDELIEQRYRRRHDNDNDDDDMELLCQEAAYVGFRAFLYLHHEGPKASSSCIKSDGELAEVVVDVAAHSLSLLALVAKFRDVQERHLYEADMYGLDLPVRVMDAALECARSMPFSPPSSSPVGSAEASAKDNNMATQESALEREQKHAEVQRKGCLLLGALCTAPTSSSSSSTSSDMAQLVAQEGGLDTILRALDYFRYHSDVANWALWAIFTICYECPANRRIVLERHGIPIVLRAMQNCSDSVEVARHGTALLFDLMRQDDDNDDEYAHQLDDADTSAVRNGSIDVWKVRKAAVDAGLHPVLVQALTNFVDEADIAMMCREMLVGTNYTGTYDLAPQLFPTR